jgi:hypothetical protein
MIFSCWQNTPKSLSCTTIYEEVILFFGKKPKLPWSKIL